MAKKAKSKPKKVKKVKIRAKAAKPMANKVKSKAAKGVPEGFSTVTPHLNVRDADQALEFYKKAFGAKVTVRMPGPGGKVLHAEIKIGDSHLFLADEMPEMGCMARGDLADQRQRRAERLELLASAMQLHRVCLAINSAVVAQPDERRGTVAPQIAEANVVAVVVGQDDVRKLVRPPRRIGRLAA